MIYKQQRFELVESLRLKGIEDESLLLAMQKVEREKFIPSGVRQHAYKDIALPIGNGQTISQPYTIAVMTQALQVKKGDKVVTLGGLHGKVAELKEKTIILEIAPNVKITVEREAISMESTRALGAN